MSQPPWETQPQPGWGPPPPPPQQPGAGGGWGQDPYQQPNPPFPAQGGGPYPGPYPADQAQYPAAYPPQPHSQQPQQPQYPQQQAYPRPYPDGDEPPRRKGSGGRTAGIVGTVILLVVGCATAVVLATKGKDTNPSADGQGSTPAANSPSQPAASDTLSFPDNSYPAAGAPTGATPGATDSTGSDPGRTQPSASSIPSGAADPATLDSAATDKTPFTAAGLVASTFKDDKNVVYTLKAASPKSCDKIGDAAVAAVVKSAKCTQFLAASWIDPSGRIIVSAMIVPYSDTATAKRISDKLGTTAHTGDYNQWCPPAGQPHADVCTKLTSAATREGKFGSFHRYVLITTAVFTDLRSGDSQKDWLNAAAGGAFQNTLPGM